MTLWEPRTWDELDLAAANRLLDESNGLELKSDITNDKLAKALAALAINGGTLLIGVTDHGELAPVVLDGWSERVSQVASMKPQPGLTPRVWTIPTPNDPTLGVVAVVVDASPLAPHMVDGRYPARQGITTGYLPDDTVQRLMERRHEANRDARSELEAYIARDPFAGIAIRPEEYDTIGRFFMVLVPRLADQRLLRTAINDSPADDQGWIRTWLLSQRADNDPIDRDDFGTFARRGDGVAMSTLDGSRHPTHPRLARELEITHGGTLRLFTAITREIDGKEWILPDVIVNWTKQALLFAQRIATNTGYRGPWACGLHLTGLEGRRVTWYGCSSWTTEPRYPDDTYTELVTATAGDLTAPHRIGRRLLERFLLAIGEDAYHRPILRWLDGPSPGPDATS